MPAPQPPRDEAIILRFGGGVHSAANETEVAEREAHRGRNFVLDIEDTNLISRPPFFLHGQAPNGAEIRGFLCLEKADGDISIGVQAGGTVYQTDFTTWTPIGNVSPSARLRGRMEANWNLDDVVLISDLALEQPIMQWDGANFRTVQFTDTADPPNPISDVRAKYAFVNGEAAWYGNVMTGGVHTPHLISRSKISQYQQITTDVKLGTSGIGADDPFFLLSPNLRPINGFLEAFDRFCFSTSGTLSPLYNMLGSDATDLEPKPLYPQSAASGDESMSYVGNNIFYGRQGAAEMLSSINTLADVEADDITLPIRNLARGVNAWTLAFNSRLKRVYMFPQGQSRILTLFKSYLDVRSTLSPWSIWETGHSATFQPTAVMPFLSPVDGLEYVFFGDAQGNVYCLDGTPDMNEGDGGTTDISMLWRSRYYETPLDAEKYTVRGWVRYRKAAGVTLNIRLLWAGESAYERTSTIQIPAQQYSPVYGPNGPAYYGPSGPNAVYYASAESQERLIKRTFEISGRGEGFQVQLDAIGKGQVQVNEVGLRFTTASQ